MLYDITDFGASVKNGAKENGAAIQKAVNGAHAAGGGTVYIPAGTFATSNIELKSNVTLETASGATLFGSDDYNDYALTSTPWPFADMVGLPTVSPDTKTTGFIYALNAKNIAITGRGTIDGNGQNHRFPDRDDALRRRPMLIYLDGCEDVVISGLTLRNPAMFSLWAARSRKVSVRRVSIYSWETENGDGLDFNGTSDVTISDCFIESGDDAISLKTNYPEWPNRNYMITNCRISSIWAGVRIGPESAGDMSEIVISNCVFENCNDALKIQNCGTGSMRNIRVSNIVMRDVHRPLFMTANSFRLSKSMSIRPELGGIKDVSIFGVTAYMPEEGREYQRNCFVISGWRRKPIENLTLRDINVVFRGACDTGALGRVDTPEFLDYSFMYADVFSINGDYPASGIFMRHIKDADFTCCRFVREDGDKRPLIFAYGLTDVRITRVDALCQGDMITARDADIVLSDCRLNKTPISAVTPFDAAQTARYDRFLRVTKETDELFEEMARGVDAAQKLENCITVSNDKWTKDGGVWFIDIELPKNAVLLITSFGDADVLVNGAFAGSCRVDRLYRGMISWTADASQFVKPGLNRVEIRWDDVNDAGGSECLLPFGEFKRLKTGLVAPMKIYF